MNIAFIQETFNPFLGGSQKRTYEIGRRLVKLGHEVHVFTVRLKPKWKREEVIEGIHVHRIADSFGYLTPDGLRNLWGVFKFLVALSSRSFRDFDVIDVNHCPLFPLLLMSLKSRKKVIATFHECWADDWIKWTKNRIKAQIGFYLEKLSCILPKFCISVSPLTKVRLVRMFGVNQNKILTLSNGVDTHLFKPPNPNPHRRKKIVFLGRLNPHKRVDLLLYAFHIISKDNPLVQLEIIGNGPELNKLVDLSRRLDLQDTVEFHTNLSNKEVADNVKHSKLLVLPSEREGQGIVLLEAMACGTPVVVTHSSGMNAAPELVEESNAGLVTEHNHIALSEGIKQLLENESLWKKFSDEGETYAKKYDWDVIAKKCEKIYEKFNPNVSLRDGNDK